MYSLFFIDLRLFYNGKTRRKETTAAQYGTFKGLFGILFDILADPVFRLICLTVEFQIVDLAVAESKKYLLPRIMTKTVFCAGQLVLIDRQKTALFPCL